MTFTASLRSEFLKIKRTSLIYIILVAAFIIPFVMFFDYGSPDPEKLANGWDHFYKEATMVFVFVFLPMFFVLTSTLLMQIEVKNNAWKQVLASPQPFFNIIFAKFIIIQTLAFAFVVVYNAYMVLSAAVLDMAYGSDVLAYLKRWPELLKFNLNAFGATIGISTLGFWLALRSKNFIAPIAIGFLLWVIGPVSLEFKLPHIDKYVFVLPFTVFAKKFEHQRLFYQLLSLGYGLFFFTIAYVEFVWQRVQFKWLWQRPGRIVQ
ncbi:ABC transporter permease [Chryseosolibacter indicus]|uniref:ABC transporter permease n=1 Tax=Chryseosolibacter indicus TaxID=2782351 RepID=A0ABS5VWG4_9BACT|nr:ABC transporter permease [Chryseosolibacter indicus]MBT1705759.1 ABC transporter permease [Chryseosolibacter indicus]